MRLDYHIDVENRRVEVVIEGDLADPDLSDGNERLREDPDFRSEYDQLLDLSGATGESLSSGAVRRLARGEPIFSVRSRRAIVVASDLGFGLARMFQTLRKDEAGEIEIFRSVDEARRWLESG